MPKGKVIWSDAHEVLQASVGYEPMLYACVRCGLETHSPDEAFGPVRRCAPRLESVVSGWVEMESPPPIPDEWL